MAQTTSSPPLVSVLTPVYNAAKYLPEMIPSILAQTFSDFEFIIADDGSTDASRRIVQEFASRDSRIQLRTLQHVGVSHALNEGAKHARGNFIALMDADDVALPTRLASQIAYFSKSTAADICGTCAQHFGNGTDYILWFPESHESICRELLFRCVLLPSSVMLRADILRANSFDETFVFNDYELWTRLALQYRLATLPQILVRYRKHAAQASALKRAQFAEESSAISQRFFAAQFPNATRAERERHRIILMRQAFASVQELAHAGKWLSELGQLPDLILKQAMAMRWRRVCRASAGLGMEVYHLYLQLLPEFGESAGADAEQLRRACAARSR